MPLVQMTLLAVAAYIANKPASSTPWQSALGFRLNQAATVEVPFIDKPVLAKLTSDSINVELDNKQFTLTADLKGTELSATINGSKFIANVLSNEESITVMYQAYAHSFDLKSKHYISEHEHEAAPLAAPLNGTVVKHLQALNTQVSKGDAVVVIEAMKMEYTLNAPFDGTLTSYCFGEGELVSHGDMLAIVEPLEA
jgi:3-methylcrotonyl-CoA carboxylase alpha subunit